MSNLQPNCCLEFDFRKVDQHAGGKWLIHDTKRRKDNQLQSLKLMTVISMCCRNPKQGHYTFRGYPAKRALPAMLTHDRLCPFVRIPSICRIKHQLQLSECLSDKCTPVTTYWCLVTSYDILVDISLVNGLSPVTHQGITSTNVDLMSVEQKLSQNSP